MEHHVGRGGVEAFRQLTRGQHKLRPLHFRDAENLQSPEVAGHRVGVIIDQSTLSMQEPCPLSGIRKADDPDGSGDPCEKSAPEQALQVDRQIRPPVTQGAEPCDRANPTGRTPELVTGKKDRSRNAGMPLDEGAPCGLDQPAKLGLGPVTVDCGDHGKGMDDIAEGTRLHQKNASRDGHAVGITHPWRGVPPTFPEDQQNEWRRPPPRYRTGRGEAKAPGSPHRGSCRPPGDRRHGVGRRNRH